MIAVRLTCKVGSCEQSSTVQGIAYPRPSARTLPDGLRTAKATEMPCYILANMLIWGIMRVTKLTTTYVYVCILPGIRTPSWPQTSRSGGYT